MLGGKNTQPLGYTILEVMIVLAISGVMFLIAASFINGKQERTAFTAGTHDMASALQDTIEQITDGKYSDIPLSCHVSNGTITSVGGGTNQQGRNPDCTFIGKVLKFNLGHPDYQIVSLAGVRAEAPTGPATPIDISAVDPTPINELISQESTPDSLDVCGLSITDTNNATITSTTLPPPAVDTFGFVQGLGSSDGSGSFQSGAQVLSLVYSNSIGAIPSLKDKIYYAKSVRIWLTDGTQTALLSIGTSNSQQLNVDIQRTGVTCP